ncbi:DNA-directed RNA polymerase II protein isoform X2 [Wolffia australiana]
MAARAGLSSSCCALCDRSNSPSMCASCVNHRLNEYRAALKVSKSARDSLFARLSTALVAKTRASEQINWRVSQKAKLASLKERLNHLEKKLAQGKHSLTKATKELRSREKSLESAFSLLERSRSDLLDKSSNLICTQSLWHMTVTSELLHKQSVIIKQVCKLFPLRHVNSDADRRNVACSSDLICNAHLPRALDPHSVPSEELGASLGYMVQLLNLVIPILAAPALHNSGFAGSCSRIWQRQTYWDARPSSQSNEYPLFIPRQNFCSSSGEDTSWSDKNASNFGVTSVESVKRPSLVGSVSFDYSSASPHSKETHKDLQKGIALLKKSVANITAYCYNWLGLEVPSEASTFEAFGKLLATLSSSKEVRSAFSVRMACSRTGKQVPMINKSAWHTNSLALMGSLADSMLAPKRDDGWRGVPKGVSTSFFLMGEGGEGGKGDSLVEGWDMVEHPTFPPPPSQTDDVEHWTRAMFIDATTKK